jgi:hypothetical protein
MSIAIACDIEGFDLDLCELDKDYFEAGKKRLEAHQKIVGCVSERLIRVLDGVAIGLTI